MVLMRSTSVGLLAVVLACGKPGVSSDVSTGTGGDSTDNAGTEEEQADFVTKFDLLAQDVGPADSHAEDMQPIWTGRCVIYCHSAGIEPAAADLSLATGAAYENIVNQPSVQLTTMMLIAPGDPDQSYLWQKLIGNHLNVGGEGEPMPLNTPMLDQDTLDRVEAWILAGAPP
jgi:hypothetical protein